MLSNSLGNSSRHLLSCAKFKEIFNPLNLQSIRWRRKPRWLPVAPSKVFRIPPRQNIPPDEQLEFRTLYNHYRTEMKSLRSYFVIKSKELLTGEDVLAEQKKIEDEEHQKCLLINEEWNKKIAFIREERVAKEKELELEQIVRVVEENKIKAQERKAQLEEIVRKEKELSKFYITRSNIDEEIEKALSNEVDYNFSIDLDGNIFRGRHTKPDYSKAVEPKKIEEAAT